MATLSAEYAGSWFKSDARVFRRVPASSPTGVPAQITDSGIGPAISTAMQGMRLKQDLKAGEAAIDKTKQETDESSTRENYIASQHLLNRYLIDKVQAETEQTRLNSALTTYTMAKARNLAEVEKTDLGRFGAYVDRVLQTLGLGSQSIPK